eukprot:CAMPEP_0197846946 /NCGR_PEP_ID=MMETSP1438-20131217/4732_1 /TAXON_ID=1461541 /ORGANISM="Pterosperma sp., Strain CCMP1384" /LENGTH=131 /DNA_ID=CAMNT_0043458737 /DNA_START=288 /DNA_END=683 /DNA_ORIENTATION=+
MRTKQLRTFLEERGVECKGCAEKSDFVQLCEESKDLPIIEVEAKEEETEAKYKDLGGQNSKGGGAGDFKQSDYRGVKYVEASGQWRAIADLAGGQYKFLGNFDTEREAAEAYDKAVREAGEGEKANFKDEL